MLPSPYFCLYSHKGFNECSAVTCSHHRLIRFLATSCVSSGFTRFIFKGQDADAREINVPAA